MRKSIDEEEQYRMSKYEIAVSFRNRKGT